MKVEVTINGKNAQETWGITLEKDAFNVLLTPPPVKSYVENKSPLLDGKEVYVVSRPKIDERDIQFPIILRANNQEQFLTRYNSFIAELQKGVIEMRVVCGKFDMTYSFLYVSCQQFNQMNFRLAKYILRLNEPNPANRK